MIKREVLQPDEKARKAFKRQSEMMAEFGSRRDAGEVPLSTEERILHIEGQGDEATAILFRRMSQSADPRSTSGGFGALAASGWSPAKP